VPYLQQRRGVDEHADADEEQAQQQVAEGPDRRLDLVPELGLAEHHAGQEGPEGHRQAQRLRRRTGRQRDEEHRQREQLGRAPRRHAVEQRPQQPPADEEDEHEGQCRLGQRPGQCAADRGRPRHGEHGYHHHERHRRHVLEHRHRHAEPGMAAMLLRLLGELLADDGGRRLRKHRADDEGRCRRQAGGPRDAAHRRGRQRHLCRAQPEHQMAQGVDLRQREVQPDREEQEHDAEFGDSRDRRRIDHRAGGVRPEQETDQQVTQARRHVQPLEGQHDDHGAAQQQQDLEEGLFEDHAGGVGRRGLCGPLSATRPDLLHCARARRGPGGERFA
jgi:hypothetical protein